MMQTADILIRLFYTCMNDAALNLEINAPVRLRVPVKLYIFNKKLEKVWMDIGCKITAKTTYPWVPKEVRVLNRSYKTWKRKKQES